MKNDTSSNKFCILILGLPRSAYNMVDFEVEITHLIIIWFPADTWLLKPKLLIYFIFKWGQNISAACHIQVYLTEQSCTHKWIFLYRRAVCQSECHVVWCSYTIDILGLSPPMRPKDGALQTSSRSGAQSQANVRDKFFTMPAKCHSKEVNNPGIQQRGSIMMLAWTKSVR